MVQAFLLILLTGAMLGAPSRENFKNLLHVERSSAGDLELGGELAGVPSGASRYVRYEDLLRLPQESYTVSDDSNFSGKTEISGVPLTMLARMFGNEEDDPLIVAIAYDKYRGNYPHDYLVAHHPLLVLRINGQLRDQWPKSIYGGSIGPYLISHPIFKPAFKVLSHEDEPQIPFGVVRIELRGESEVFGAIRPRGDWPADSAVQKGYVIARQDCFRCHNMGAEGGTVAGRSWMKLGEKANEDGKQFRQIIRNPASVTPGAEMPSHAEYDDATMDALTAYFRTFAAAGRVR
ncbi:MAG: c-type cytochrome [Terracidiphilus sp.]|jgi:cytochrome c2